MSNPDIISLYSTSQAGGELPYFVGKQYGSGWLQTIGRFALPILRRIGLIGMKTAQDVISNNAKVLPTLKSNALSEIKDFMSSDEFSKMMPNNTKNETNLNGNGFVPKHNGLKLNRIKRNGIKHNVTKRKGSIISSINKRMKGYGTIFEK